MFGIRAALYPKYTLSTVFHRQIKDSGAHARLGYPFTYYETNKSGVLLNKENENF